MEKKLTEIQILVTKMASIINVPKYLLPQFNRTSEGTFIEIDGVGHLFFVATERGQELSRYLAHNVDDLLYKVFDGATLFMASTFTSKNGVVGRDFRRVMWQEQERLLRLLDESWKLRHIKKVNQILREHPFDDYSGIRVDYFKELVKSGQYGGEEWALACEKFPLPKVKQE